MQFMPVVEHVRQSVIVDPYEKDAEIAPWSVSSQGFGRFMCEIFDYWVRNDVGQYFVNLFDATLAGYCGVQPGTCAYASHAGMGICVMESAPYILKMRELLMNRRPPSDVMTWARAVRDI
jgi:uncharacterized protein